MIDRLRSLARRVWPVMRLRWVFIGILFFVAALPGFAALGLRVYENALMRRTEAEVAAQGAAIAATAALLWQGAGGQTRFARPPAATARYPAPETEVDLRYSPVLAARPAALPASQAPDAVAIAVARKIAPVIAETKQTTLASILLLDSGGTLLDGPELGRSLAALPEVRAALGGRRVTVLRHNDAYAAGSPIGWISRATAVRLHHARPIVVAGRTVGVVLVSRSPAALFRGMWEDAGKIAAGTAMIAMLLVLLTAVLVRAIVRPIEKLSEASRALASGLPAHPRRPTLEVSEIRSLYDDFEHMAASIAHRSGYLRDFAAALSHEFKTPLAGLRGGIELLQDHGANMSEAERERFLANIAGDTDRLSRLVSRMMELAKADMRGSSDPHPVDLAAVAGRVADAFATDRFAVAVHIPHGPVLLAIDPAALETVLTTLVENAAQSGASRVAIVGGVGDGSCKLEVEDDGPGVPVRDRDRIFDPFHTSRREAGGTGLGLPIARSLARNAGGSLDLVPGDGGARFLLTFPLHGEASGS